MATATAVVELIKGLVAILATIAAGSWAYYHFVKGRVFKPRLTLTVTGRRLGESAEYVVSTVEVKNVGLSRVAITNRGTALQMYSHELSDAPTTAISVPRARLGTFRILQQHTWVEPGETLTDTGIVALPPGCGFAIALHCRVIAHSVKFTAMAIITRSDRVATDTERPA